MDDSESVIEEHPAIAGVITVAVAAVSWAGISLVMRDTVDPVETALFAVVFSGVYVGFAYFTEMK